MTGDFQAGERIKENEMAQQLGVSRGPIFSVRAILLQFF
ncbi:hypothetical protein [Alistipes sp.]